MRPVGGSGVSYSDRCSCLEILPPRLSSQELDQPCFPGQMGSGGSSTVGTSSGWRCRASPLCGTCSTSGWPMTGPAVKEEPPRDLQELQRDAPWAPCGHPNPQQGSDPFLSSRSSHKSWKIAALPPSNECQHGSLPGWEVSVEPKHRSSSPRRGRQSIIPIRRICVGLSILGCMASVVQSYLLGPAIRLHPRILATSALCKTLTTSLSMTISFDLLKKQNAETSNALIEHWKESTGFSKLAKYEGDLTIGRDEEDAVKLQKGIDFAKSKGVIDPNYVPQPYVHLDVLGKTPDSVADAMLSTVKENSAGGAGGQGSVIVLCGLSGTGKGTTVAKLRQKLEEDEGKQVVTWSNGNIFRSVTLLAVTWCEQNVEGGAFDKEKALTKENLQTFVGMLSFGKFNGKYDTRINGLGLDMLVSEVQNTELKSPKVSKNIPTVAEVTQGEVILFAAAAVETMGKDGLFVLLEGREQTVNYVRSPDRFILELSDPSLIGKRRAAQRLMADALKQLGDSDASEEEISKALDVSLEEMVKEIK